MLRGAPTLADFRTFVTDVMQVPASALDPNAPLVEHCFDFAYNYVNPQLRRVPNRTTGWSIYQQAVYNLAADTLANWATDAQGAPIYMDGKPYWAYTHEKYGIGQFVAGVLSSTSDNGTSASFMVPEGFNNLTIANLANLKTPWGRTYLGIAQSWGGIWGRN